MNVFNLIKGLSNVRSQIMGLAMIWVIMFHYGFDLYPFSKIAKYGFTGVDLFLFLSGMGLFFSLHKNPNTMDFYKRRFIRIFPTYFLLGGFATYILDQNNQGLVEFLWIHLTLGYWTNGIYEGWFIPALIFLYFIFPLIYHTFFEKNDMKGFTLFMSVILFLTLYWILMGGKYMNFNNDDQLWKHTLFLYRCPIFFLGTLASYVILERRKYAKIISLIAIVCLVLVPFFYFRRETMCLCFTTSLATPFLLLVLSLMLNKLKLFNKILGEVGNSSLEIYIIHFPMLHFCLANLEYQWNPNLIHLSVLIITLVVGIICHTMLGSFYKLIKL